MKRAGFLFCEYNGQLLFLPYAYVSYQSAWEANEINCHKFKKIQFVTVKIDSMYC